MARRVVIRYRNQILIVKIVKMYNFLMSYNKSLFVCLFVSNFERFMNIKGLPKLEYVMYAKCNKYRVSQKKDTIVIVNKCFRIQDTNFNFTPFEKGGFQFYI